MVAIIYRTFNHLKNGVKAAKAARRQRRELQKTIRFTIGTILMTYCYFVMSETILPSEKFWVDKVYRDQLQLPRTMTIFEIWDFINDHVVNMNFPSD